MRKWIPLGCLLVLTFTLTKFKPFQSPNHPLPTGDETIIFEGEEEENQGKREAWFALMHQAAVGTDWKAVEYQNRFQRHENRAAGINFRDNDCGLEIFAYGQLKGIWKERGSINQAGSVFDVAYDPVTDQIWLISAGGTIFTSDRLGLNWSVVNQDLQFDPGILNFIPHNNSRRLIAFSGRIPHYSDDDGLSWNTATGIQHDDSWGNFKDPVILNDGHLNFFVLAKPSYWEPVSLYHSNDHGESFELVETFYSHEFERYALCSPHHSNDLYLLIKEENGKGKIYSIDPETGDRNLMNEGNELNYGESRANLIGWASDTTDYFYAYTESNGQGRVFSTPDITASWQQKGNLPSSPWRVGMYVLPSDPKAIFMGNIECFKSLDGGESWQKVNEWWEYYDNVSHKLHADIMAFGEFETSDGLSFLMVSNHGGLSYSEDKLESQVNIGLSGLNVSQYYSVRTDPIEPNYVYAGSQDQGLQLASTFESPEEGGEPFEQVISGDYGHLVFTNEGSSLWAVYPGGVVSYYQNAQSGNLTHTYGLESEEESVWLPPLMSSPYPGDNAIYMAGGNINGGAGSHIIRLEASQGGIGVEQFAYNFKEESAGGAVSAIAVAPTNALKWYAATTNGRFFYSEDGGESWEQSLNFIPEGQYLYGQTIYVSPVDEEEVYLGGSGYSNPAVYRSGNGGFTFGALSLGLPSTLVLDLEGNDDGSLVFAATESGPYVFVVEDNRWYDISGDCTPLQTYWSVEFVSAIQTARFGTYGRGIWDFALEEEVAARETILPDESLSVYPNPSRDRIFLQLHPNDIVENAQVRIFDLNGREVFAQNYSGNNNELDLAHLPQGTYLLKISTNKGVASQKIILQ